MYVTNIKLFYFYKNLVILYKQLLYRYDCISDKSQCGSNLAVYFTNVSYQCILPVYFTSVF